MTKAEQSIPAIPVDRFTGGFVLNLGDLAYREEDRISVLPLCRIWS